MVRKMGWDDATVILESHTIQDRNLMPTILRLFFGYKTMSTALVRYAAGRVTKRAVLAGASPYVRAGKRVRYAAAFAYKNRGKFARAARVIGRAYRRHRKNNLAGKARAAVGVTGKTPARASGTLVSNTIVYNTRTLYVEPLIDNVRTASTALAQRDRDIIYLAGISMDLEVSIRPDVAEPVYINIAILKEKDKSKTNWGPIFGSSFTTQEDFFRADGGDARSTDFDSSLTALQFHSLSINSDLWHIFSHKRYRLNPPTATNFTSERGSSFMNVRRYVKIGKKIKFSDINRTYPETGQIFAVYWADRFGRNAAAQPTATWQMSERIRIHWRDVK